MGRVGARAGLGAADRAWEPRGGEWRAWEWGGAWGRVGEARGGARGRRRDAWAMGRSVEGMGGAWGAWAGPAAAGTWGSRGGAGRAQGRGLMAWAGRGAGPGSSGGRLGRGPGGAGTRAGRASVREPRSSRCPDGGGRTSGSASALGARAPRPRRRPAMPSPAPPTELVPSERAVVLLSCALSALGSGLLVATHALWPDLRSQARRLLLFLSLADLLSAASYFYGVLQDFSGPSWDCVLQGALSTFANTSSFFWTVAIALYLYLSIVHAARGPRAGRLLWAFHIVR